MHEYSAIGLVFVAIAIIGWGFGDFFIQRSARKLGDWEALFFITFFCAIVLAPFVYQDLASLTDRDWTILSITSTVLLVAALLDFDALRVGKISVIEPIYAMEVPLTIALSAFLLGEFITLQQFALIITLLLGIYLVTNKRLGSRMRSLEKGIAMAVLATIGMGVTNFLFGYSAREIDPLMINWFTSVFAAVVTFLYLLFRGDGRLLFSNWRHNKTLLLCVSVFDNLAWIGYSYSTLYLPIGIATGLSERYIALGAILGLTFNREKLVFHQKLGLLITVCSAIILALSTQGL